MLPYERQEFTLSFDILYQDGQFRAALYSSVKSRISDILQLQIQNVSYDCDEEEALM